MATIKRKWGGGSVAGIYALHLIPVFLIALSFTCTLNAQSTAVERKPMSIGILVDANGSMAPLMSAAHEGLNAFLDFLHPGDEMFMMVFGQNFLTAVEFTSDTEKVSQAFGRFVTSGDSTLHTALEVALEKLNGRPNESKALVLITVGLIQDADLARSREALRTAKIPVHSIGMPVSAGPALRGNVQLAQQDWEIQCERALRQFAEISNGSYAVVTDRRGRLRDYSVKTEFQMIAGRLVPEVTSAHLEMSRFGAAHLQAGRYQDAVDVLLKIGSMGPLTPEDRLNLGLAFYRLNNLPASQQQLNMANSLAPGRYPNAYLQLHNIYMNQRKVPEALVVLEDYLQLFPRDALHEEMSARAAKLRDLVDAARYLEEGLSLKTAGRRNEALQALETAVRLNPALNPAKTELATMYVEQEKYPQAVELFSSLVQMGNASAEMYFELGSAQFRSGRVEQAEQNLEHALELNASLDLTYLELYSLHMSRKEYAKALTRLESYLKLFPDAVDRDDIQTRAQELRLLLKR
jgi:tetratricopeptide (TPR) repeat protein